MRKLGLLVFAVTMSVMMPTGGQAISWLPMRQPMLDLDRSWDLVVEIKTKKHDGNNNANQQGEHSCPAVLGAEPQ